MLNIVPGSNKEFRIFAWLRYSRIALWHWKGTIAQTWLLPTNSIGFSLSRFDSGLWCGSNSTLSQSCCSIGYVFNCLLIFKWEKLIIDYFNIFLAYVEGAKTGQVRLEEASSIFINNIQFFEWIIKLFKMNFQFSLVWSR